MLLPHQRTFLPAEWGKVDAKMFRMMCKNKKKNTKERIVKGREGFYIFSCFRIEISSPNPIKAAIKKPASPMTGRP
jgi:hypothetical protein